MAAKGLKAVLFLGSAREGRLGSRVCTFITNQMKERGWSVDVIDPLDMGLPILSKPIFFYKDPSEAPEVLKQTLAKIKEADAFIVVTCEYNHCLPPGLTNIIDHFSPMAYKGRPSSIICYSPGMYGGMRAAMQARALLGEINCPSIPNIFGIPRANNAIDEQGEPIDDHMIPSAEKHLKELEWYANALKAQREKEPLS